MLPQHTSYICNSISHTRTRTHTHTHTHACLYTQHTVSYVCTNSCSIYITPSTSTTRSNSNSHSLHTDTGTIQDVSNACMYAHMHIPPFSARTAHTNALTVPFHAVHERTAAAPELQSSTGTARNTRSLNLPIDTQPSMICPTSATRRIMKK